MRREFRWQDGPWVVQYDRGVTLRSLPGKQAKAPLSNRSVLGEGGGQPRKMLEDWAKVTDFDSYAALLAVIPEKRAEVDRRM